MFLVYEFGDRLMSKSNIALLKNITVLYAEDEQALRDVTVNILNGFTKKQFVAEDGMQGLELFKKHKDEIDLIITDVNMPNMNGLEMAREIKALNASIPIIVATAFSNSEYLLEAINLGIDKYVLKPVDMKKLLNVMSQSLLYHELKELYIDGLTSLPNRNKLKKDLEETPEDILAMVDIDKFSTINDLYGEEKGDTILFEFSKKLKSHFEEEIYNLYRIEADKFAVVVKDVSIDIENFKNVCKDFATFIEDNEIIIDDNEIDLNITIGIAKSKGSDAYKHAQRVMNYARKKFAQILVYDQSFNIKKSFEENIKWVKKIKTGLANNQFKAYYQPIVNTQTKEVYKYEALVRYIDNDGSAVSPFVFLDIAKRAKLYPNIIKVMLNEAFVLIKEKNKRVAINISFDDIASEETVLFIKKVLKENEELTHLLEMEILESEEIDDFNIVAEFIDMVKSLGCKIGVDDFGAGYSNFNMLVNLNIDFVKIDGTLIKDIVKDDNFEVILETIVSFSDKIGFDTVAEFVSDEEIYNTMKKLGVKYCQGYYFGKPEGFENI